MQALVCSSWELNGRRHSCLDVSRMTPKPAGPRANSLPCCRLPPLLRRPAQPAAYSSLATMSTVKAHDLAQLGEICSKICYHLTAFIKDVADGKPAAATSDISKLYQLALALPAPTEAQWAELSGHAPPRAAKKAATNAGTPSAPLAEGAERAPGKRLKWTQQLEGELIQLVEDDEFRKEKLGASRGVCL